MTTTTSRFRHLRCVVGPSGAGDGGLQEAFLREVARLKTGAPLHPVAVVVGSNYVRLHLSRLLAERLGGHANIRFMLLEDIAREYGTPLLVQRGRRRLPDLGRELILREVVQARTHGTCFESIAGREGFQEAIGITVRDLKEAGIDSSMLRAGAEALRTPGPRGLPVDRSARKLEDLADLQETYEDRMREQRFYDAEDLMRAAVDRAEGEGVSDVLVYGFYDATWMQRRLLQSFLAFKKGTVFLPHDPPGEDGGADYALPMLEWLRDWIPSVTTIAPPSPPPRPDGTPRAEQAPPVETGILSAPGEPREALEAVRWCVGIARRQGVPLGECAIVYRSADPYRDLIADALLAAGVPHFQADGQPLSRTRPARALALMLRAREEGFSRRAVIDLFALTHHEDSASWWDRLSKRAGVVRGIEDWRARLGRLGAPAPRPSGAPPPPEAGVRLQRAAAKLLDRVEALHEGIGAIPDRGAWKEIAACIVDLLDRWVAEDPALDQVTGRVRALGALDDVSGEVSLERFAEVALRALERPWRHPERDGHFQRSGVFVGSVIEARMLSFRAVACVGLVERAFPRPPRQDPILLDEERDHINRLVGPDRLALASRRFHEEGLYFRMVERAASDAVLLSWPRLDPVSARPRSPSPFLLRAASRLEGRPVDHDGLDALARTTRVSLASLAPSRPADALLSREFDLGLLGAIPEDPAERRRVASFLHANPVLQRAIRAEEARWGEARMTPWDGVIARPAALDALRALHDVRTAPLSAHRIESYAKCPLAYFMKQVLDLEEMEEPEDLERLDPLRKGGLVHDILFDTYTMLRDRNLLPLRPATLKAALGILHAAATRCFEDLERAGMVGFPLMWRLDQERIRRDLEMVLRREAADEEDFVPRYFEFRYGDAERADRRNDPASTSDPARLEMPEGPGLLLKGVIDRVDVSPTGGIRVTDYKTGRMAQYRENSLRGGRTVQLPLYMSAAHQHIAPRHGGARVAGAQYRSVDRRGEFRSIAYDAATMEERREDLGRIATTFVNGVARGAFFAMPGEEECRWCAYKLACGEGREARFARKRDDEAAADLIRLREECP